MKNYLSMFLIVGFLMTFNAVAEPLLVTDGDSIQSILSAHKGKRVTIKLKSGNELTGTVGEVNGHVAHLRELSGKEYYDAVTSLKSIEAIVIRTKN